MLFTVCAQILKWGHFFSCPGFGRMAASFNITLTAVGEHTTTTDYLKL